jgi:hypothetical protein
MSSGSREDSTNRPSASATKRPDGAPAISSRAVTKLAFSDFCAIGAIWRKEQLGRRRTRPFISRVFSGFYVQNTPFSHATVIAAILTIARFHLWITGNHHLHCLLEVTKQAFPTTPEIGAE